MNETNAKHQKRGEEISRQQGGLTRRELLKKASPLGIVTLVDRACTACGICALECSTGALFIVKGENENTCQLLFHHYLCTACGSCVEICPERCLRVERTLDLESLNRPAEVLFEDEIVTCAECRAPFTTRATINSVRSKLGMAADETASYLELCPGCKAGIRSGGAGV
jgi:formate hydrogenlyase subunit 6/NADH:ubiquinone oxidoreductase subunit I